MSLHCWTESCYSGEIHSTCTGQRLVPWLSMVQTQICSGPFTDHAGRQLNADISAEEVVEAKLPSKIMIKMHIKLLKLRTRPCSRQKSDNHAVPKRKSWALGIYENQQDLANENLGLMGQLTSYLPRLGPRRSDRPPKKWMNSCCRYFYDLFFCSTGLPSVS